MVATTEEKDKIFPTRKFFWCNEEFHFAPLPEPNEKHSAQFEEISSSYFTGEHDKIVARIKLPTEMKHINLDDDDQIIKKGNQKTSITELDRLAWVIHRIDQECAVVPYESQKTTSTDQLLRNIGYRGIGQDTLNTLASYRHYRKADEKKINEIRGNLTILILARTGNLALNTLESLDADIPAKCWSISQDVSGLVAYLRNFKWPGFLAYNRANTPIYGYCYFGDGRKVSDLMFTV